MSRQVLGDERSVALLEAVVVFLDSGLVPGKRSFRERTHARLAVLLEAVRLAAVLVELGLRFLGFTFTTGFQMNCG